jgi:hypothetical protein
MAEVAERQLRSLTRPVLIFRLTPCDDDAGEPTTGCFCVEVVNAGAGPALNVGVRVDRGPLRYQVNPLPSQPLAIAAGERQVFVFTIHEREPFLDEAHGLRWPRNEEDAETDRIVNSWREQRDPLPDPQVYFDLDAKFESRMDEFRRDVADKIAEMEIVGYVLAKYRDLAEQAHESSTPLVVRSRGEDPHGPNWPTLALGPFSVTAPLSATATVQTDTGKPELS